MRKMVNNRFKFQYNSYDELIKDIPILQREGFAIDYGEQFWDKSWCIQAKRVNTYIIKDSLIDKYFLIYDRYGCIKYEGVNNLKKIFNINRKINIKDLDKNERIKYLYKLEHIVDEREIETIKKLNRNELTNLINLALELELRDTSWLKILSQCFKERY